MILVFIIWIIYLETSPSLGNIVFRPNQNNQKVLSLNGIWQMLKLPLYQDMCWNFKYWDLNIYVILALTILIIFVLQRIVKF